HIDDVVGALRVTDQDQRAAVTGGMIFDNLGNCRLPGQMPDGLGFDPLAPELCRHRVEPGREYAKPAAQEIDSGLRLSRAAPNERNGNTEDAQYFLRFSTILTMQRHWPSSPDSSVAGARQSCPQCRSSTWTGVFRAVVA